MPVEGALEGAVVLRLELVVELLGDPLADLAADGLDVEAGRKPLDETEDQVQVAKVDLDRFGDARILDLDGDRRSVPGPRPMDLPDRRGRERLALEVGERLVDRPAEVVLDDLADVVEAELRRVVAELRERGAELLLALLGEARQLDRREHLPDLHRGALHLTQLPGDLHGDRGDAVVGRALRALFVAGQVRQPGPGPAQPLPGDHPADTGGSAEAPGADPRGVLLVVLAPLSQRESFAVGRARIVYSGSVPPAG